MLTKRDYRTHTEGPPRGDPYSPSDSLFDHLGSASWITDHHGEPVQHLAYLPFGEELANERMSGYSERFTFTGKELDAETGYSYFGARYYDPATLTAWLSVDPMADKYPSISPYAYCAWNPLKLVDPDGEEFTKIMEYYAQQIESFCDKVISRITKIDETCRTDRENLQLKEFQDTKQEIMSMRNDKTTLYCLSIGLLSDPDADGSTNYGGTTMNNGDKQDIINVSVKADGFETSDKKMTRQGLTRLSHELKHGYQFFSNEMQFADDGSGIYIILNDHPLEKDAYSRSFAFFWTELSASYQSRFG